MAEHRWFNRRGDLVHDGWESVVGVATPGWQHTGLRVGSLVQGDHLDLGAADVERIVVPLAGSFVVFITDEDGDHQIVPLAGRTSVFAGPTDVLYLAAGVGAQITGSGRFAVAEAPTTERRRSRYVPADQVAVELRGAGTSSRQVHNFGTPANLDAARLIVCEVITPAGNWSSFPPHKHDEQVPGHESRLEEIYYFESAPVADAAAPEADAAFGMFSTYSSPAGAIDIDARVMSGDIALVPYGYHGPAVAAPGYDLYYLNVMAGPDPERAWLISDDPAHAWIRDTWNGQDVDPRLPFTTEENR